MKNIVISRATKHTFLMLLFLSIIDCVIYFYYEPISPESLKLIKGTIKEIPYIGASGGDMPQKYIKIELNEDNYDYFIQDCAYYITKIERIKKLCVGDSVEISTIALSDGSGGFKVYNLYSHKYGDFLLLKDYNYCYTKEWKILFPFIVILGLVLIYQLINNNYFKRLKGKPNAGASL